jgi:hypothetical protein
MSQMRKEASPPSNKPFHRIGGKRPQSHGELHVMRTLRALKIENYF